MVTGAAAGWTSPAPPRRHPLRTAGSALGLLREALWLRLFLAIAVLSVAFVFLGRWQYHRHEAKVARNTVIDANYEAAPVPLGAVLPDPAADLTSSRQWTPVEVSGVYEPDEAVLVRHRPLNGQIGYEVIVPLRTSSGAAVLVDRGWIPVRRDLSGPGTVPAPPAGQVMVIARLRPSELAFGEQSPTGHERRIDLARLAPRVDGEVYRGAYALLASERPAPGTAPTPLPRPDESLGPHLAYAYQWWLGAVAAWVLLGVYAVREVDSRAAAGPGAGLSGSGGHGTGLPGSGGPHSRGVSSAAEALRARRRRRQGPSDEEWEDAVVR